MLRLAPIAVAALLAVATAASAEDWRLESYAGATLKRSESRGGTVYPMERGQALGASVYYGLTPGLWIGADLMGTRAEFSGNTGEYVDSTSLMFVMRKEFAIGGLTDLYAGAGVGAISNRYDDNGTVYEDTVSGAQISVGARYAISQTVSVFGEAKYQAGLGDAFFGDLGASQSYETTTLSMGVTFDY